MESSEAEAQQTHVGELLMNDEETPKRGHESPLAKFIRDYYQGNAPDPDSFCDEHGDSSGQLRQQVDDFLRADHVLGPGDKLPRSIAGYRIKSLLGEGGMGIVYLAEQKTPVRRLVALKLIKPGMDSKRVIGRFEAERQALALMEHPTIAKIYDAGTTPHGQPFFAMEYFKAIPITEYCDRSNAPLQERLRLFMEVCKGVQHAHQKAVIHRDLKPSNILVTESGGHPIPRIIDFGLAKALGPQRLTEQSLFTEHGVLMGTPEYASPEQAELTGLDVDTRTDIYSLGVVLYQLLTGTLPFEMNDVRDLPGFVSLATTRQRICEKDPPKPSDRVASSLRSMNQAVSRKRSGPSLVRALRGDLDWITMKAIEKDRARRYSTTEELRSDLARHLSGDLVLAGPPNKIYRTQKFVRKHSRPLSALAALFLVMAMGTLTVGFLYRDAIELRDKALEDAQAARDSKVAADRHSKEILNRARGELNRANFESEAMKERLESTESKLRLINQQQVAISKALTSRDYVALEDLLLGSLPRLGDFVTASVLEEKIVQNVNEFFCEYFAKGRCSTGRCCSCNGIRGPLSNLELDLCYDLVVFPISSSHVRGHAASVLSRSSKMAVRIADQLDRSGSKEEKIIFLTALPQYPTMDPIPTQVIDHLIDGLYSADKDVRRVAADKLEYYNDEDGRIAEAVVDRIHKETDSWIFRKLHGFVALGDSTLGEEELLDYVKSHDFSDWWNFPSRQIGFLSSRGSSKSRSTIVDILARSANTGLIDDGVDPRIVSGLSDTGRETLFNLLVRQFSSWSPNRKSAWTRNPYPKLFEFFGLGALARLRDHRHFRWDWMPSPKTLSQNVNDGMLFNADPGDRAFITDWLFSQLEASDGKGGTELGIILRFLTKLQDQPRFASRLEKSVQCGEWDMLAAKQILVSVGWRVAPDSRLAEVTEALHEIFRGGDDCNTHFVLSAASPIPWKRINSDTIVPDLLHFVENPSSTHPSIVFVSVRELCRYFQETGDISIRFGMSSRELLANRDWRIRLAVALARFDLGYGTDQGIYEVLDGMSSEDLNRRFRNTFKEYAFYEQSSGQFDWGPMKANGEWIHSVAKNGKLNPNVIHRVRKVVESLDPLSLQPVRVPKVFPWNRTHRGHYDVEERGDKLLRLLANLESTRGEILRDIPPYLHTLSSDLIEHKKCIGLLLQLRGETARKALEEYWYTPTTLGNGDLLAAVRQALSRWDEERPIANDTIAADIDLTSKFHRGMIIDRFERLIRPSLANRFR